jgi:hypothetical protein
MRKIAILLVLLACLIPFSVRAENDPFNVNASLFYADFPSSGGTGYVDIYVQNTQPFDQTITVSPWIEYTYPDEEATGGWIQPEWMPSVTPSELTLAPNQSALFSVAFSIPATAPELVYKTWVKVSNGEVNKPITVWVRKGEAVPSYSFSLLAGSGAYICKVSGYGASAIVDEAGGVVHPIGIRSKCKVATKFQAILQYPAWMDKATKEEVNDDAITQERVDDPDSAIFYGKQEEVGNVYKALPIDAGWITLGTERNRCDATDPLIIKGYETGYIPWSLTIPDSAKDGCYWAWVHVLPAEPVTQFGTGVGIDYISKIYIEIDRSNAPLWKSYIWIIGMLGVCVVGGIGWWGIGKIRKRGSPQYRPAYRPDNRLRRRSATR